MLFTACRPQVNTANTAYVDVQGFIAQQDSFIKLLKGHKLKKTLTVDGKSETKELPCETFDLKKELTLFRDIDITKPAYKGVFGVDTTHTDSVYSVVYQNNGDNHLPLKTLTAGYSANNILTSIAIYTKKNNLLSVTEEWLKLYNTPKKIGYSVSVKENLKTGNNSSTEVVAEVVR